MRRASELRDLRRTDVTINNNMLTMLIRRQKNDQLAKGQQVFIEATHTILCPVDLMRRYIAKTSSKSEWLFINKDGHKISTSAISSIVRKAAAAVGVDGHFSSHSLRIGGATAALEGGMSKEQIKAIGGWSSEAVEKYMRARAVAQLGVSAKMGL
jgi:site-specific recombinase XerD